MIDWIRRRSRRYFGLELQLEDAHDIAKARSAEIGVLLREIERLQRIADSQSATIQTLQAEVARLAKGRDIEIADVERRAEIRRLAARVGGMALALVPPAHTVEPPERPTGW
jgi:hypothetical protein